MAKEIIDQAVEQGDASGYPVRGLERFEAIVFKKALATADFSCSESITLPGEHLSAETAWGAVYTAMRDPSYIGGEVRRAGVGVAEDEARHG